MNDAILSRLAALRTIMAQEKLDGFIVPMADEFQNEYVPASARRVEYICGFTGSAAQVIILRDRSVFFTDSRYTLQAQNEVPAAFTRYDTAEKAPPDWLTENMQKGQRLGYDPWLQALQSVERLQKAAAKIGVELVAVERNPLDATWSDRPAVPVAPVTPHGEEFSGKSSATKRQETSQKLRSQYCAAVVLSDPSSTAWLLNIRGGDVPHTPLPLSFSILYDDATVDWFVDPRKLTPELVAHLGVEVRVHPATAFADALTRLGGQQAQVSLDPQLCAAWIAQQLTLSGAKLLPGDDPCALPRACKNAVEQAGTRAAHRRDGAALARFFAWLAQQPPGSVGELQAEQVLESCRTDQNLYRDSSFTTIAGSGAHGAIVHYRATTATDRKLQAGELFLLDSGGQYLDGTTDVTRTVAIGTPTAEMRDRYTRVVKGHIALASARFPVGTTGAELDVLARQFLWAVGLDYGHGTGHGVGSYLGVHEGPQSISRRARGSVALQPGMILSNEPGYYKPGSYGIRFENLMLVTEPQATEGGALPMLGFDVLTLSPLDRTLLEYALLTRPEIAWINAYHARVREEIYPQIMDTTQEWLSQATSPLSI
jgi:Xaa-Pro aminopeptidase